LATRDPSLALDRGAQRDRADAAERVPGAVVYLVWLPIALFIAALVVLYVLRIQGPHESALVLATLNTLFGAAAGLVIAYLAARTYLVTGSRAVLAFGVGALAFGLAGLLAGLIIGKSNEAITVHNTGVLLAGASFTLGAIWALAAKPRPTVPHPLARTVTLSYLGALAFMALLTAGALGGVLPKYYVPSQGGTTFRSVVLGLAIAGFLTACVLFGFLYRGRRTRFLLYCCAGLAMIGIGLWTVLFGGVPGSPLNWLGRSGQYLGAAYLTLAILSAERGRGPWLLPLERALRESESRYQSLVDRSPDAIVVKNDEIYVFANQAAAGLFGARSPEDVVGRGVMELIHPDDRQILAQQINEALAGAEMPPLQIKVLRLDGIPVEVEVVGARVEFDGVPAVQAIMRDITARRRVEEALRTSEDQLRQSQKMEAVGQLAGGIAHDFNNLLTAIIGYSDLALSSSQGQDETLRPDLEEIKHAADRASALTRQILAFSRRQALHPMVVSLNDVLAGMEPLLHRTLGEDVELVTLLHPDLSNTELDVHQFEQVIMNLALNARDAMPAGGRLTLETGNVELDEEYCRSHADMKPGSYVMMSASDTGVGMDQVTASRVFEPFYTTKAPGQGTGLGLSTVYGIVRQSGGGISVDSEPDRGTSFKVYVPRVGAPVSLAEMSTDTTASFQGEETVLVVEDEEALRNLVARVLVGLGYHVLRAASGSEAIELLSESACPVDLLLTDVILPGGMQGNDLAHSLLASRPDLPVLYMSGYTRNTIVHAGRLDTGVNYLEKPFTPVALAAMVRQVLDSGGSQNR